ncbi:hypothetical protein BVX98_08040 [bacterium F11]|nr:hypothetical protein BVX98_08040 [bacterium F11]
MSNKIVCLLVGFCFFGGVVSSQECGADLEEMNYLEKQYALGLCYWEEGEWTEAKNHWLKYSELCERLCGQDEVDRLFEVRDYLDVVRELMPTSSYLSEEKKIEKKPAAKKNMMTKSPQDTFENPQRGSFVEELIKKAELAYSHGQPERAMRYFKLGLTLDPSSQLIQTQLDRLKRELD